MSIFDRFIKFKSKKRGVQYAPYPVGIYRELLARLKDSEIIDLVAFNQDTVLDGSKTQVFIRHDIDTAGCVSNLPGLLKIDAELGLVPGVFFLVSGDTYDLSSCKSLASTLYDRGYPLGLHTVCYLEDDYMSQFQREIDTFTKTLGVRPDTFNAHGLGNYRLDTRLRFYDEVADRYKDFGFSYSDCTSKLRAYNYVFEDCHWDTNKSNRYLKDDFMDPIKHIVRGNMLVMTHPCYWSVY